MVFICSSSGRVFILSDTFWAFSWASLNLAYITFIYENSTKSFHICVLSSQCFTDSSSTFLMLAMTIIVIFSLPVHSSSGILGVVHNFRSTIFYQKPLMTLPIFNACCSVVASTTIETFSVSLYNFWTTAWVFCAIHLASSFSYISFLTIYLDSLLYFIATSTFPSTSLFCWSVVSYCCSN
jgi:hypothetical protein